MEIFRDKWQILGLKSCFFPLFCYVFIVFPGFFFLVILILPVNSPSCCSESHDDDKPPPPGNNHAGFLDKLCKSCLVIKDVSEFGFALISGLNGLCKCCFLITKLLDDRRGGIINCCSAVSDYFGRCGCCRSCCSAIDCRCCGCGCCRSRRRRCSGCICICCGCSGFVCCNSIGLFRRSKLCDLVRKVSSYGLKLFICVFLLLLCFFKDRSCFCKICLKLL